MDGFEKYLIDNLIILPKNDKEIGFNSALITILQGLSRGVPLDAQEAEFRNNDDVDDINADQLEFKRILELKLNQELAYIIFNKFSLNEILDIKNKIISRAQLAAIKIFKEISQLDLKTSKDIIDLYKDVLIS